MRIYHFELPKIGDGLSGGEHCLLEVLRYLKSQQVRNVLVTSDNGRSTYTKLGFHEDACLEYQVVSSERCEKRFGVLISYVTRTVQALRLVCRLRLEDDAVLLCNSDAFPNAIPFWILARRNPRARLIYWFRMLAPDMWKGYLGHYRGTYRIPTPRLIYFRLSQWFYRSLVLPRGIVLISNPAYEPILRKQLPRNAIHVLRRYTGRPNVPPPVWNAKHYDMAWMGRFHAQKGLFEMIDIVRRLKLKRPNVSIVVIGGGNERMLRAFQRLCQRHDIASNVDYKGYISDSTRYQVLGEAKLFLMTSYFEGYPNVVVEAMSVGLPVVAYDFPFYAPFQSGMVRIPPLDNAVMTEQILALLQQDENWKTLAQRALQESYEFSWDKVGAEILQLARHGHVPDTQP